LQKSQADFQQKDALLFRDFEAEPEDARHVA